MSEKYTPGPWKVSMNLIKSNYDTVAQVFTHLVQGRNEANARLIAAAPELLKALMLAESVYRQNCVNEGEPSSVLDAMQAAIAKATGEQQ